MIKFFHLVEQVSSTEFWWVRRGSNRFIGLFSMNPQETHSKVYRRKDTLEFFKNLWHFANSVDRRTVTTLVLILVLCLLCVTPLVYSCYSSFARSSIPFPSANFVLSTIADPLFPPFLKPSRNVFPQFSTRVHQTHCPNNF